MDNDFYRTQMGQRFYTQTVPDIAKALTSIAESLKRPTFSAQELSIIALAFDYGVMNYDFYNDPRAPRDVTDTLQKKVETMIKEAR